jgi:lysophospholipase L1-like esterase
MKKQRPHLLIIGLILAIFTFTGSCQTSQPQAYKAPPRKPYNPDPNRFLTAIEDFRLNEFHLNPPENPILFVGSSSFRLWDSLEMEYERFTVINRGFGGSIMRDVLYFFDDLVLHYRPRAIFIYEGDNDISGGMKPEEAAADFENFVARVREELGDIPLFFVLPKPSGSRWHLRRRYKELSSLLEVLAVGDEGITLLDTWDLFLTEEGKVNEELFLPDRLHLSEAGYDVWRGVIGPILEELEG